MSGGCRNWGEYRPGCLVQPLLDFVSAEPLRRWLSLSSLLRKQDFEFALNV